MAARRSTNLHFHSNGKESPTAISYIAKITLRTIKCNIAKFKKQGTIDDWACKS